jgi:hypothetical protein
MKTALLPLILMLAACAELQVAEPPAQRPALPPPAEDTCGAGAYAALIGRQATTLETVLLMRQVRLIRPDTMVTMDFRPERINFEIDENERIFRIYCG